MRARGTSGRASLIEKGLEGLGELYSYVAVLGLGVGETLSNNASSMIVEPYYVVRSAGQDWRKLFRLLAVPVAPLRAQWAMGNRGLKDVEDSNSSLNDWLGLRDEPSSIFGDVRKANREFLESSIDCDAGAFMQLSSGEFLLELEGKAFFTFDAQTVYTGPIRAPLGNVLNQVPPGAHGDLRDYTTVGRLTRRERTLRFLYGFTRPGRSGAGGDTHGCTLVHAEESRDGAGQAEGAGG